MWSFGCILVELFTGYPIFPGENEQEQLSLIMELRGLPPDSVLDQATRRKIFFDEETDEPLLVTQDSRGMLRIPGTKSLQSILSCSSASFVDFIERCLDWDPSTRITPFEALLHDWIIEGLPPKVLLHHKRMLGVFEDSVQTTYRTNGSPQADKLKRAKAADTLNRTCVVKPKEKADLNRTGLIQLSKKEDLTSYEPVQR